MLTKNFFHHTPPALFVNFGNVTFSLNWLLVPEESLFSFLLKASFPTLGSTSPASLVPSG